MNDGFFRASSGPAKPCDAKMNTSIWLTNAACCLYFGTADKFGDAIIVDAAQRVPTSHSSPHKHLPSPSSCLAGDAWWCCAYRRPSWS